MSGLLAAAGHFHLGPAVRDQVKQRVDAAKEKEYNASLRKKDEYDALFAKVQEIRNLNLPSDKWDTTQLKTMVKCYKRDGDDKLPNKKQDLIARYLATCHHGEMLSPVLPEGFEAEIAPQTVTDEEDVARILLGAASYRRTT